MTANFTFNWNQNQNNTLFSSVLKLLFRKLYKQMDFVGFVCQLLKLQIPLFMNDLYFIWMILLLFLLLLLLTFFSVQPPFPLRICFTFKLWWMGIDKRYLKMGRGGHICVCASFMDRMGVRNRQISKHCICFLIEKWDADRLFCWG